ITVIVEPPDVYVVRFALLGESLDASLDVDKRYTSANGHTSVKLVASESSTTFRLRASAGPTAVAEVPVSVSNEGFASVLVLPSYKGIRSTPQWTASALAGWTCAQIPGQPPDDGPIVGVGSSKGIRLESLPVGPTIAVTLRSQQAVGGCTEVTNLAPGESREVSVKVSDMPIRSDDTRLDITMASDPLEAIPLLDELTDSFLQRLFPSKNSEAKTLLDAMQSELPASVDFDQARLFGGWDALVAAWLDKSGQSLREHIQAWVDDGLLPLRQGEWLTGRLTTIAGSNTHGVLNLERFHGLAHERTGIPTEIVVSVGFEPGDIMMVGGKISWLPSRFVGAAADVGAKNIVGTADAIDALVALIGCNQLPALLSSTYPLSPSCDAQCLESACHDAVSSLWNGACHSSAISLDTVQLSFTISGTATVNGDAAVIGLDAAWVGTQSHGDEEMLVRGNVRGSLPSTQSR
ncbi:MAG TPA: hypothetical protein PK140_23490, partial [Polyangiaceae bacterium]|nr:hypothetical protein [Polyangiaceae bacterium]